MKLRCCIVLASALLIGTRASWAQAPETPAPAANGDAQTSWNWKLKPQPGAKYELRFYLRHEVHRRLPVVRMYEDASGNIQESESMSTFTDIAVSKATFEMEVIEANDRSWKARLTCKDSSASVVADGLEDTPAEAKDSPKKRAALLAERRSELASANARFLKVAKGARIIFACDAHGQFLRWYGAKAWVERMNKARNLAEAEVTGFVFDLHPTLRSLPVGPVLAELQSQIQIWLEGVPKKAVRVNESWSALPRMFVDSSFKVRPISPRRTLIRLNDSTAQVREDVKFAVDSVPAKNRLGQGEWGELVQHIKMTLNRQTLYSVSRLDGLPTAVDQSSTFSGFSQMKFGGESVSDKKEESMGTTKSMLRCVRLK